MNVVNTCGKVVKNIFLSFPRIPLSLGLTQINKQIAAPMRKYKIPIRAITYMMMIIINKL